MNPYPPTHLIRPSTVGPDGVSRAASFALVETSDCEYTVNLTGCNEPTKRATVWPHQTDRCRAPGLPRSLRGVPRGMYVEYPEATKKPALPARQL